MSFDPILQRFKSKEVEADFREWSRRHRNPPRLRRSKSQFTSLPTDGIAMYNIISNQRTVDTESNSCVIQSDKFVPRKSVCGRRILEPDIWERQRLQRKLEIRSARRRQKLPSRQERRSLDTRCEFNIITTESIPKSQSSKPVNAWSRLLLLE